MIPHYYHRTLYLKAQIQQYFISIRVINARTINRFIKSNY